MNNQALIVTDLDGTLLNHHDYQVTAAVPILQKLEQAGIPVIFNTSKTYTELTKLSDQLNNQHPFIAENGSAIFIPENYFSDTCQQPDLNDANHIEGYQVVKTGCDYQTLLEYVEDKQPEAINFVTCSVEQASQITGLTKVEAHAAQDRQFSIPLMFQDLNREKQFSEQALRDGFGVLKGGRFLHLLGQCDKGQSMLALKDIFQVCLREKVTLIALGDSPNDEQMLAAADLAVIVNSPSSGFINSNQIKSIIKTRSAAPEGWVEGVESALKHLSIMI